MHVRQKIERLVVRGRIINPCKFWSKTNPPWSGEYANTEWEGYLSELADNAKQRFPLASGTDDCKA